MIAKALRIDAPVLDSFFGIQDEYPSYGKLVLIMRDSTERPESVEMGTLMLVIASKK